MNYSVVYGPYVWLQATLRLWLGQYLSNADAARTSRRVTAELIRSALIAWDTEQGPFAHALDMARGLLAQKALAYHSEDLFWVMGPKMVPTEKQLDDLCLAYVCTYELGYLAEFSFREREDIMLQILSYDLLPAGDEMINDYMAMAGKFGDPLRRAVNALEDHPAGQMLVCQVTAEMERQEQMKSRAWRERTILEEVK